MQPEVEDLWIWRPRYVYGRYFLYVRRYFRRTRRIWRIQQRIWWRRPVTSAEIRSSDLRVKVKLNLKEISTGVEKKFKLKKYIECSHRHGTGAEGDEVQKPVLHVTERVSVTRTAEHFRHDADTVRMSAVRR